MNPNTYWHTIGDPGKFEGEPILTRYLWKKSMNGCFDTICFGDGDSYQVYEPSEAESIRWALEPKTVALVLHESEQGFVTMSEVSKFDLERLERESEEFSDES